MKAKDKLLELAEREGVEFDEEIRAICVVYCMPDGSMTYTTAGLKEDTMEEFFLGCAELEAKHKIIESSGGIH
jgi:hypothetical protein